MRPLETSVCYKNERLKRNLAQLYSIGNENSFLIITFSA